MKMILAAIDFSDASDHVLNFATNLSRTTGAGLHVVHVFEPEPTYTAYGFTAMEFPAIHTFQEEAQVRAQAALDHRMKSVSGGGAVSSELLIGSAVSSILAAARDRGADLVVVGSHGHGAMAALFLGSVAEGLVRKNERPVLVVPAKE